MRLRSAIAACLLLIVAAISVRETRCGSECQAAAALFAANAAMTRSAMTAMPGMEDCPMAKASQGASVSSACVKHMVHAPEAAQTEEHVRAPEFNLERVAVDSILESRLPSVMREHEAVDTSPPGRSDLVVSLQSDLRI